MRINYPDSRRKAPSRRNRLSPQERARVCEAIHRYLEIEATRAATAKRNVRLRLAIGLPPIPRREWRAI